MQAPVAVRCFTNCYTLPLPFGAFVTFMISLRRIQMFLLTYLLAIFVVDIVIRFGRYGLFVWPMWLWPIWFVADMVLADMVCASVADMVQTHQPPPWESRSILYGIQESYLQITHK